MNKERRTPLCHGEDSEVTFRDGEGAQPLRTTHTERRRKEKKKSWTHFGRNAVTLGLRFSPAVHAHWCAYVQRCGARLPPQRTERVRFYHCKCKSQIFLKVPRGCFFFLQARLQSHPLPGPPPPAKLTRFWLTSLHHLQVSPLLSRCFWVREAFEYRAAGTWWGKFVVRARAGPVPTGCSPPRWTLLLNSPWLNTTGHAGSRKDIQSR